MVWNDVAEHRAGECVPHRRDLENEAVLFPHRLEHVHLGRDELRRQLYSLEVCLRLEPRGQHNGIPFDSKDLVFGPHLVQNLFGVFGVAGPHRRDVLFEDGGHLVGIDVEVLGQVLHSLRRFERLERDARVRSRCHLEDVLVLGGRVVHRRPVRHEEHQPLHSVAPLRAENVGDVLRQRPALGLHRLLVRRSRLQVHGDHRAVLLAKVPEAIGEHVHHQRLPLLEPKKPVVHLAEGGQVERPHR
mmetsp:Transcript_4807/g.14460  ORF Transcript_4807/g.14460 Transcript_4807/m.14460 type:complete len:244 (+) Transcript_4807:721-1452(+)